MRATVLSLSAPPEISPWTGRFYSLLDPSYAKNNIPIIASVSEHQPTSWSSFYFDLQLLVFMFPVGLYFCFSKLNDANIFIILYGITSIYFAVSAASLAASACPLHVAFYWYQPVEWHMPQYLNLMLMGMQRVNHVGDLFVSVVTNEGNPRKQV